MTEEELTALEARLLQQSKLGPINVPRSAMRSAADAIAELRRERDEARIGWDNCGKALRGEFDRAEAMLSENAALKERVALLEAALLPFSREADAWEGFVDAESLVESWNGGPATMLIVRNLRDARAALDVKGAG